ncbi:MXAN_6652 family MXYO-CTERM-anchored protein [Corallococcus terminator]
MRLLFRLAGVFAVSSLWSLPAFATGTGITGQSGKGGPTCNTCHTGGETPTVALEGPTTLEPGGTGQYTFIIRGGAAKTGGVDIAVSGTEAVLVAGANLKKLGAELVHTRPMEFSGNELRFAFSLTAPSSDVTLTLFGAGNSSNADQNSTGDRAATTSVAIQVGKGTPTAPVPGDDDGGGCAAAGGVSSWALAMLAVPLALRRRRS